VIQVSSKLDGITPLFAPLLPEGQMALTKNEEEPQNYDVVCGHVCALRRYKIRAGGRHAEAMSA
jgi:hypothetical protein